MSSSVSASIVAFDSANSPAGCGVSFKTSVAKVLAESNGADEANVAFAKDVSLAASASAEIDLQADTDAYGDAMTLTDVAALWLEAPNTNPGDIIVEQGAANGFSSLIQAGGGFRLAPGEFMLVSGFALGSYAVSATNKTIKFTNTDAAGSATVMVRLLGRK